MKKSYPEGMAFPNWIANKMLTKIANLLFGIKITDEATCYKAFNARVLKTFNLRANRFEFCPEVTAKLAKHKIRIMEIPISYHARTVKEGKKVRAIDLVFAVLTLLWERITK